MPDTRTIVFRGIAVSVIRKASVRRIGLRVDAQGNVGVTAPLGTQDERILAALEGRHDWILNSRQKMHERHDATFRPETLEFGDLEVHVKRRATPNVEVRISAPDAVPEVTAPFDMPLAVVRGIVEPHVPRLRESRDSMIKGMPARLSYVTGERHLLWGEKMELVTVDWVRPGVRVEDGRIVMGLVPGMGLAERRELMRHFYRQCVLCELGPIVARYEELMGREIAGITCRFMKSRWGSCTPQTRTIRVNCMLARYPRPLLEYVVVHEMCHFVERGHGKAFRELEARYFPECGKATAFLDRVAGEILI